MCHGSLKNHGCEHLGVRWDYCPNAPFDPSTGLFIAPCERPAYYYPEPRNRENSSSEGGSPDTGGDSEPSWKCSQCEDLGVAGAKPCRFPRTRVEAARGVREYLSCGHGKCPAKVKRTIKEAELQSKCCNETIPGKSNYTNSLPLM